MPCNSEYMNPTAKEKMLQETARLLIFVLDELDEAVPEQVRQAAENPYCSLDLVPTLCARIRGMSGDEMTEIVYNGYNRTSRQLADWWETHEKADMARLGTEKYTAEIIMRWVQVTGTAWPSGHQQQKINHKHIMDFAKSLLDNPPVKP